jgi:hypothetical protein
MTKLVPFFEIFSRQLSSFHPGIGADHFPKYSAPVGLDGPHATMTVAIPTNSVAAQDVANLRISSPLTGIKFLKTDFREL